MPLREPQQKFPHRLNCQVGKIRARQKQTRFSPERPRTCVGWRRDPRVEHTQWMPHSQIQAKPTHFDGPGRRSKPKNSTSVILRGQRCVEAAWGSGWEAQM